MDNNDTDHRFEDGTSAAVMPYYDWTGTLFRKLPGCVVTMTYNNGNWTPDQMDIVVSHEVGHIFRAPDEYAENLGGCDFWDDCVDEQHYGYLNVVNGNCDECIEPIPCVMFDMLHNFCPFTLSHLGWRDDDMDQVADALKLNNGPWEIIPNLHLGDIVRFYTFEELDFVNSFAVSPDRFFEPSPGVGWTVWDSHNYDGQPVAVTYFYYTINDGSRTTIVPNPSNPNVVPQFANVSYQNDTLQWTLQSSWANVRCFIYDGNLNLVSRPVWDKLLASSSVTKLDMRLLPYEQSFTAKLKAWRHDGAVSELTFPFYHGCTWLVGDADGNGVYEISDAIRIINYIFSGGPAPEPHPVGSGDANCTASVNTSDQVYLINYIFGGGPAPGLTCSCEDYF